MKLGALLVLGVLLNGCATRNGRCYPVVGLGWINVNTNQPVVRAAKVLGLNASSGQVSVGFSSVTVITVPTNANVVIDLRQ